MRVRTIVGLLVGAVLLLCMALAIDFSLVRKVWPYHGPGVSVEFEIVPDKSLTVTDPKAFTASICTIVQSRIDPLNSGRIRATVVRPLRLRVWMDGSAGAAKALAAFERAKTAFMRTSLNMREVDGLLTVPPEGRDAAVARIVSASDARHDEVIDYLRAGDLVATAAKDAQGYSPDQIPTDVLSEMVHAHGAMDFARQALQQSNLTWPSFDAMLVQSSAPHARRLDAQALADRYPAQGPAILVVAAAYADLVAADVAENLDVVTHMTALRGDLEFRIAVDASSLTQAVHDAAVQSLLAHGSETPVTLNGDAARWFPVALNSVDKFNYGKLVTTTAYDRLYVLLCDDAAHTLLHDRSRAAWSIVANSPFVDSSGMVLPFRLDSAGAQAMSDLTGSNSGRQMTILLDDEALAAPTIHSRITDLGVINFGSSRSASAFQKEAVTLQWVINTGEIPATLVRVP